MSAEIVVQDKDILHTFRTSKASALDVGWYRRLPEHIGNPNAVLLDLSKPDKPVFLLIYALTGDQQNKLVVAIDYALKKVEGPRNVITSGRSVRKDDVLSQIDSGNVIVLEGEV